MILIAGGGVGGLTLALSLQQAGIACRVYEAAPAIQPLGVGINLLPHAMREYTELGLQERLAAVAVTTRELAFANRYGQVFFREPRGKFAGYEWPQLSIHRGELHKVLLETVLQRLGSSSVELGKKCISFSQSEKEITLRFEDGTAATGAAAVGCDGVHSAIRKQLFPHEGPPAYQNIIMWRGVTRWKPFLTGASMVIGGWLTVGKLVAYPIRDYGDGTQQVNWLAEIQSPRHVLQDWNAKGRLEDFLPTFADWRFDWLDVAGMFEAADMILEYPMVDRDPLPFWSQGRATLLGDAAHPMYPRGSNGAGQAILDARTLAGCLRREKDVARALKTYERLRIKPAYEVVLINRENPPDALLREVYYRTGDKPYANIDDVISRQELVAMSEHYKRVAGFERDSLARRESLL